MKGVIFTEFLEMVEEQFSPETADRIIEASDLSTDGAYTSVGTYDYQELAQLVSHLGQETGVAPSELLRTFGHRLFGHFRANYGTFFDGVESAFDFLRRVEAYIHVEVRKLYDDAELPTFEYDNPSPNQLTIRYRSTRPLADLALGLIEGCTAYFKERVEIERTDLSSAEETQVQFTIRKLDSGNG